jgi:hypothetical protein
MNSPPNIDSDFQNEVIALPEERPTYPVTGVDSVKCNDTGSFRFTYNNIEPSKTVLRKPSKIVSKRGTRNNQPSKTMN